MSERFSWAGRTVLVTGATGGIGRAVTRAVLARGARVGGIARSGSRLAALAGELGVRDATLVTQPADVGNRAEVDAAVQSLADALGPADVLVACAGIGLYGPASRLNPADAEAVMRANYFGTLHAVQAVLPAMLARRSGNLVLIGSIAGRIGTPFEAAYSASKFAVVGFGEALAVELSPFGIGVSIVDPGPTETSFYATRRYPYVRRGGVALDPPGRVAAAVVRAVEGRRSELSVRPLLGLSVALRHLVPPLYEWGVRRAFRRELERLAERTSDEGA